MPALLRSSRRRHELRRRRGARQPCVCRQQDRLELLGDLEIESVHEAQMVARLPSTHQEVGEVMSHDRRGLELGQLPPPGRRVTPRLGVVVRARTGSRHRGRRDRAAPDPAFWLAPCSRALTRSAPRQRQTRRRPALRLVGQPPNSSPMSSSAPSTVARGTSCDGSRSRRSSQRSVSLAARADRRATCVSAEMLTPAALARSARSSGRYTFTPAIHTLCIKAGAAVFARRHVGAESRRVDRVRRDGRGRVSGPAGSLE
jgi:hypothetical protein